MLHSDWLSVRVMLGLFVLRSFLRFKTAVSRTLGKNTATWLTLLTVTQFHFMFYMSRPLPNTFALCFGEYGSQELVVVFVVIYPPSTQDA